jgi:hypothetical protein
MLVLLKHRKYLHKWYKLYEQEQFVTVLENSDALISQFSGDEIVSKFNCLKQTLSEN